MSKPVDMSVLERHEKRALAFSGGKDSLACVYLLADRLPDLTVYHVDTGDFLPETRAVVQGIERVAPRFVRIETDAAAWMAENGMPSDLLPFASHAVGRMVGQERVKLSARYDCCFANVMWPLYERIKADGNTLLIRGTKRCDEARFPAYSGDVIDGVEVFHPIEDWSDEDVWEYLQSVGAKPSLAYERVRRSMDCARCPAWWSEGRGAYLKQHHPQMFADYQGRLATVYSGLDGSLRSLAAELEAVHG